MMRCRLLLALCQVFVWGCGGARSATTGPTGEGSADASRPTVGLEMRHQILFSSAARDDVFEGIMLLFDDAFFVKAFAGPGVELFTVARRGQYHKEVLHIDGLADRIDVTRVGADINRVYLAGCEGAAKPSSERRCIRDGETVIEAFDADGRLATRRFPDAHGIGLTITYKEYVNGQGRALPKRITLAWGTSKNCMVILMVSNSPAASDAIDALTGFLEKQ